MLGILAMEGPLRRLARDGEGNDNEDWARLGRHHFRAPFCIIARAAPVAPVTYGGPMLNLYIANKNYSSWSMRPWVLLKQAGIPFEEVMVASIPSTASPSSRPSWR